MNVSKPDVPESQTQADVQGIVSSLDVDLAGLVQGVGNITAVIWMGLIGAIYWIISRTEPKPNFPTAIVFAVFLSLGVMALGVCIFVAWRLGWRGRLIRRAVGTFTWRFPEGGAERGVALKALSRLDSHAAKKLWSALHIQAAIDQPLAPGSAQAPTATSPVSPVTPGQTDRPAEPDGQQKEMVSQRSRQNSDHPGIQRGTVFGPGRRNWYPPKGDTCPPVWQLVQWRRFGKSDAWMLATFPLLSADDLRVAWDYAEAYPDEIDKAIRDDKNFQADRSGKALIISAVIFLVLTLAFGASLGQRIAGHVGSWLGGGLSVVIVLVTGALFFLKVERRQLGVYSRFGITGLVMGLIAHTFFHNLTRGGPWIDVLSLSAIIGGVFTSFALAGRVVRRIEAEPQKEHGRAS